MTNEYLSGSADRTQLTQYFDQSGGRAMSAVRQNLLFPVFGFFVLLLSGMNAVADDTDIFFGDSTSSETTIKPNLMFVLDTSGSMRGTDDVGIPRIDRMKTALSSIISTANNVNVGVMRFNGHGAAVLYPVRNIDEVVPTSTTGTVIRQIAVGTDDAEEIVSSGAVTLTNSSLSLTTLDTSAPGGSIDVRVSADNNDGEERVSNGSVDVNGSSDLELMSDGGNQQVVGVRFPSLDIPAGATITSASIEFTVRNQPTGWNQSVEIDIYAEAADTGVFVESTRNISNRIKTTSSVNWSITANSPATNATFSTPDLIPLVQELVSKPTWSANPTLTFIFQREAGSGVRNPYSYGGSSGRAARLRVSYTTTASTEQSVVGLRFQDVSIPQGAKITSARIGFTNFKAASSDASYYVKGEAVDNAATFTTSSFNIAGRPHTTSVASWSADAWTTIDEVYETPDLSSVVQQITDRSGWCGGNSMSFMITEMAASSSRFAKAFESSSGASPVLTVSYDTSDIPEGGGCDAKTYSAMVTGSANDAEEFRAGGSTGNVGLTSSDIELMVDGSLQMAGLRFQNLQIPNSAEVTEAYLELTSRDSQTGTSPSLTIKGQAADNASVFTSSSSNISSRPVTSASVAWTGLPSWSTDVKYKSPDIKNVIQEVVNRTGWAAGNSMALLISGTTTGLRRAETYDGDAANAPRLVIRAKSYAGSTTARTVRDEILGVVSEMQTSGGTPIVDSLYEASLYFKGMPVDKGLTRGTGTDDNKRYDRVSSELTYTGGSHVLPSGCSATDLSNSACITEQITGSPVYNSPIEHECQANHIVLLSDGEATQNTTASKIRTMTGVSSCTNTGNSSELCGVELSTYLSSNDQLPAPDGMDGNQYVRTHTIGFNIDTPFLESLATDKEEGYYRADTATELIAVFDEILTGALNDESTFVSPGVTVNSFNRFSHRNELYFSLFRPDTSPDWPGNLKRYELKVDGNIYDKEGVLAIDEETGFFDTSAKSWWRETGDPADGKSVEKGGAASKLPAHGSRKIYTHYTSSPLALTNASNAFSWANKDNITKARLGIEAKSDAYHEKLINWARGMDVDDVDGDSSTTNRNALGDPLHSVPHLVTYGGTDEAPDITIYYGDNQGFLHAIDSVTGVEQFAFIPEELLANLDEFYINSEGEKHPYGLDGSVTSWIKDVDGDKQIEAADGDHVYIYVGMRRGGRNYYALDVTDRDAPKFMWQISGGAGDFAELGQTWSKPALSRVNIDGTQHKVLIFTGGYDENQDDVTVRTADSMGRAIYIVDAEDGSLLWSGGNGASFNMDFDDMLYSIPSDVRIIDIDGDHLFDQMYVGDMGGQIWRFDINHGEEADDLVSGGVIADFAGSTAAANRRFFHAPSVSVLTEGVMKTLLIAIGSGHRERPLGKSVDDRFYVLKNTNLYVKPSSYVKLTEADLFDTTENDIGEGATTALKAEAHEDLNEADGWFIRFDRDGEKVTSSAATVRGEIFFTTYEPKAGTNPCNPTVGTPRMYHVHAADGTPVKNYEDVVHDDEENLTAEDREMLLHTKGLPSDVQILRIEDAHDVACSGTECMAIDAGDPITRTYWIEEVN